LLCFVLCARAVGLRFLAVGLRFLYRIVPHAKLLKIIVRVQKLKLTAMQNGSKNCTKKLTMFMREINMLMM
jgi:hypothetical protein